MKTTSRKSWKFGLTLCGVVFAILGIGMMGLVVLQLVRWSSAQSWVAVDATPLSLEQRTIGSSSGYPRTITVARYRYSFDGRDYESGNLTIGIGESSFDDTKDLIVADFSRALADGTTIPAFVDPLNPANATCHRGLPTGAVVGQGVTALILGVIGALILRRARRDERFSIIDDAGMKREVQIEPEWSSPELAPNVDAYATSRWIPTAICAFFAITLLAANLARGTFALDLEWILTAVFSLATIILLVFALRKSVRLRALRGTLLRLDPYPGSIGGSVGGTLLFPPSIGAVRSIKIEVRCEQHTRIGAGRSRQTVVSTLWRDTLRPEITTGAQRDTKVQFSARVPEGLPESTQLKNPWIEWRVDAHIETERGPNTVEWHVPVFAGERASTIATTEFVLPPRTNAAPGESGSPWGSGIERPLSSGFELEFAPLRSKWVDLTGSAFAILIGACFWFFPTLILKSMQDDPFGFILFRSVGVAAPILVIVLTWSIAQNSLHVVLDRDGIRTRWSLLGRTFRRIEVPRNEIKGIAPWGGAGVVVIRNDDRHHIIVRGLEGDSAARYAAEVFARRASLPLLEEPTPKAQ